MEYLRTHRVCPNVHSWVLRLDCSETHNQYGTATLLVRWNTSLRMWTKCQPPIWSHTHKSQFTTTHYTHAHTCTCTCTHYALHILEFRHHLNATSRLFTRHSRTNRTCLQSWARACNVTYRCAYTCIYHHLACIYMFWHQHTSPQIILHWLTQNHAWSTLRLIHVHTIAALARNLHVLT